jgi:Arc/MetJ family transcription regulator
MRTNIVLDEALVAEAIRLTGATSKRAVVEQALRALIAVKSGEEKLVSYRDRVEALQTRTQALDTRVHESAHDMVRADRDRRWADGRTAND